MFEIRLKNDKVFKCDTNTTIFDAANNQGIVLEHSCLKARCRSCVTKVLSGATIGVEDELVLTEAEKTDNYILSCNAKPISDLLLDIEDLNKSVIHEKKIVPAKVNAIEYLCIDVVKISLRLPPTVVFEFTAGQYVNIIKGNLKRSYSIANKPAAGEPLEFYIKKFSNGLMSKYWFEECVVNDLLRIEGPIGSFFLRETTKENIILMATGTGIGPINAILEQLFIDQDKFTKKIFWVFFGARHEEDLFWKPKINSNLTINFIPVLSRSKNNWNGERGYIQEIVLKKEIDLLNAQVYACGSGPMIESARQLLTTNNLPVNQFFSDTFICTN